MKKIKLTQGKFALVDDADFGWLSQWKWRYSGGRAIRSVWVGSGHKNRKSITIHMHRLINKTPDDLDTDHVDRNPLNNCRNNLRSITHRENMFNKSFQKNNKLGIKGVSWDKENKKWRADIKSNEKRINLGRYSLLQEAIIARKNAEVIYHGM